MLVNKVSIELFEQLLSLCESLEDDEFTSPLNIIHNATVGKHIRHILEFYIGLKNGLESGVVSYDKRSHDQGLETSRALTSTKIKELIDFYQSLSSDKEIELEFSYPISKIDDKKIATSVEREIVYNIEHAIHHMAIIRIAVEQNFKNVAFEPSFGVAQSTIVYNN
ncbi:DinB family protein [Aureibacter tunicatorum]|uniref:Damage-inducible protein DinB n=1 Tax=Aureibacter tunicatorum TaxID=866807 RepID=A0AAE3XNW8_9BACT|nr:DinB family protein [Aureibacter tunicatorum]MDR6239423.1 putative damage-inducible protein DinB [Aureibacter tunicatorum]BDD04654.1 hypothetical protein AUTU_21370 [Aureibacter tunicatorum]